MQQLNKNGAQYDSAADRYGLNYSELIAPTVKALQEVDSKQQEIDRGQQDLNTVVAGQQKTIETLKAENELMKAELCKRDKTHGFCKG